MRSCWLGKDRWLEARSMPTSMATWHMCVKNLEITEAGMSHGAGCGHVRLLASNLRSAQSGTDNLHVLNMPKV